MADPLLQTLVGAGFKGPALRTAWAIAKRESGGRAEAYNPDRSTGDDSYGLFQINMLGALGPSRRKSYGLKSNRDLLDPATNARVAFAMSKGGKDFGAWGIGPNAYRKMPALDFSGYPGAGGASLPPKGQAGGFKLPDFSLDDKDMGFNFSFGDDDNAPEGMPSFKLSAPPKFAQMPMTTAAPTFQNQPFKVPKGEINTSTWTPQGSHITDGLDLNQGRKTAVDIMAKPGTAVAAPASGTVLRLGSAQGGDSMYFKDDQGYVWWLGHIDSHYSLPAGTRVQAGQTLSRISADHAAPHLHLDRTLSPTNRFG